MNDEVRTMTEREKDDLHEAEMKRKAREPYLDKVRGCLIGGAAGDALGYPVEFLNENEIRRRYGKKGITAYVKDSKSGKALISDDTQMTLFTANGLLVGDTRGCLRGLQGSPAAYVMNAYMDWYTTQDVLSIDKRDKEEKSSSWLMEIPEMYVRRVPGNTCLSALRQLKHNGAYSFDDIYNKRNDSKGNGGLMRVAPLALDHNGSSVLDGLDKDGADIARITHCHSLGYMPAAFLTHVINRIVYPQQDMSLEEIIKEAKETILRIYKDDENVAKLISIVNLAMKLAGNRDKDVFNINRIGEGWVAEETLGIALYCALRYRDDFSGGIIAAVNHDGDSDTTAAVAGNILGALCGYASIEQKWKDDLELSDIILEIADDLCYGCVMEEYSTYMDPVWIGKYIHHKWFADKQEYKIFSRG